MSKLMKLVTSFILFLFVFNTNSISYSQAYKENKDIILKINQDSFFSNKEFFNQIENIKINQELIQKNVDFGNIYKNYFSMYLFYPIITTFLVPIILPIIVVSVVNISNSKNNIDSFSIVSNLIFAITNSFLVYTQSKDYKKRPYYITLVGSILGLLSYFIITSQMIFFESIFSKKVEDFSMLHIQELIFYFIMPLFVSYISTIFYDFSKSYEINKTKNSKPEEMTEEKLSKLLEEQSKSIKEFSNKVRISGNSVSFSLVKF